jgi:hypothetical protein
MTLTPAQVARDPERFASGFLRILDKEKNLVPLRWNKAQRNFHKNRTGRDLILKARQLGFSTYVQGELYRRAVTSTRTTMTMAHDDETTQKLRRMADRFWEHHDFNGIKPLRKYANDTMSSYPEFDSECIIATAGSKQAGRGGTYTDFHGSEVAFWPNAEKIIAGAMQGGNPDVILESTPNGAQGYFYERCNEALSSRGIWKLHFYPWWWDDAYRIALEPSEVISYTEDETRLVEKHQLAPDQIKWRRRKQEELRAMFVQEYPEDPVKCFLTSGNGYFGDIDGIFTAPGEATYQEGHKYSAGLDWGQEADYTALIILDRTERVMVDHLHIRMMSWGDIRARVKSVCEKWRIQTVTAEKNSIGSVNIEALNDLGMGVNAFDTTNESKARIMSAWYEALHGGWKLQDWDVIKSEHRSFVSKQLPSGVWQLAAAGDGHDDTVIASALAYEQPWMMVSSQY